MLKKIVVAALAATIAVGAYATDKLTVLNTGSKTGYFAIKSKAYGEDLAKKYNVEFVSPGQYCAAMSALKNIDGPVLFPWAGDFEAAGRSGKGCATVELKEPEVVKYYTDVFRVCTSKDFTKEDFLKKGAKWSVGHSTPSFAFQNTITAINKNFGTEMKSVHYADGGGAVKTAMLNKEVDFVIIAPRFGREAVAAGAGKCFYALSQTAEDGLTPLGSLAKDPKLNMASDTVWILKNGRPGQARQIRDDMQAAKNNPASAAAQASKTDGPVNWNKPYQEIVRDWNQSVDNLRE